MFEELNKYKKNGHFIFRKENKLNEVCNAPNDKSGVYIVYALESLRKVIIYIGRSGKIRKDGSVFIRKVGLGGIKDRIVNGHQFGKIPRRDSWPNKMLQEKIKKIEVYWYITHSDNYNDCPRIIENLLLKKYFNAFGRLPKWNNKL